MEQKKKEQLYIDRLSEKDIVGLLVATNALDVKHMKKFSTPIVAFDCFIDSNNLTVMTDKFGGAKKGTAHLIESGAKNLFCLREPRNVKAIDDREKDIMQRLKVQMLKEKQL